MASRVSKRLLEMVKGVTDPDEVVRITMKFNADEKRTKQRNEYIERHGLKGFITRANIDDYMFEYVTQNVLVIADDGSITGELQSFPDWLKKEHAELFVVKTKKKKDESGKQV